MRKTRPTIEDMRQLAKERDSEGKCLSDEYVNSQSKLEWQCGKGHVWRAIPNSIVKGSWCPICSHKRGADKLRGALKEMQEIAKSKKGKCLSFWYVSATEKLRWCCAEGHVWMATPDKIKNREQWCPICAGKRK